MREEWGSRFSAAVADDLDLPRAMALVAELVRSDVAGSTKSGLLTDWDRVLGLDLARTDSERVLPAGAEKLIAEREKARAAKDFVRSDQLREELKALGVDVFDRSIAK